VSFIRRYEEAESLVLHNVSDVEVTIKMNETLSRFKEIDYNSEDGNVAVQDGELKMPAYSTVVLKKD
jgi:hypothetical protein